MKRLLISAALLSLFAVPAAFASTQSAIAHIESILVVQGNPVVTLQMNKEMPNPAGCTASALYIDLHLEEANSSTLNTIYLSFMNHHQLRIFISDTVCSATNKRVIDGIQVLQSRFHDFNWRHGSWP